MNTLISAVIFTVILITYANGCNQDLCICRTTRVYCLGVNKNQTDPRIFMNLSVSLSYYSVIIRTKNFTYLPGQIFQFFHIQLLDLSLNEISFIRDDSFSGIYGLKSLFLNKNKIKTIDNIIAGLTDSSSTFSWLNLFGNLIETISVKIPSSFNNLVNLNFNENPIKNISSHVFMNLTNLSDISFYSNDYLSIIVTSLAGLENLRRIRAKNSGNNIIKLKNIPWNNNTVYATDLIFSNSYIVSIESNAFINFREAEYLDLSNNLLETINEGAFRI